MSDAELQKRFEAALASREVTTIDGLQAAEVIFKQAEQEEIECAIAGGIAMHLYGYGRATEDVDLLASKPLSLPSEQKLSFGGDSHLIQVGNKAIRVDVIVRDDFFREFYEAALRDAKPIAEGKRIVAPEWMVILKYLARRSKDILDLLWMLREPGLVDRDKVLQNLNQVLGEVGAQSALRGLEHYYVEAEIMRGGDENGRQER
ncbi:MAG: hypothetical protein JST85_12530 [Acidobacteria bacterium]|nr:hypothetical protein [Acidobacteriota bacterium]